MEDFTKLLGLWSADAYDPPGAMSDEWLLFDEDGTGYQEYANAAPNYAMPFQWSITSYGRLQLDATTEYYPCTESGAVITRDMRYSVAHGFMIREENLRGKAVRVLHLDNPINDGWNRFSKVFVWIGNTAQPERWWLADRGEC